MEKVGSGLSHWIIAFHWLVDETPNTGEIGYKLREFNRRSTGFTQINWMKM